MYEVRSICQAIAGEVWDRCVALCKIYFLVPAALPATINARFSAVTIPRYCSPKAQSNGNCREPVVRELMRPLLVGNAVSDVATGAKEGRRQRILQCEKREYVRVTLESWRLSYISMYALGGAIQKSVRFPKHHQNYILPYNASTAVVAACCRPTSPSASFDGKDR
jgi:hypothetical protein